jgi:iron(III) transport system substrate-binding protein
LFWNEGILHTLTLDRAGLLRPFSSAAANEIPNSARSPRNTWYAIASDARVLIVNANQIAESRRPTSILDLTDPQWYERAGIAKPLTGHSATHAACLFQTWGDAKAAEFFTAVKRNARILLSDREVATAVAKGSLAFGLTNSSDAVAQLSAGAPVTIIYPDQDEYGVGTLFIPMTVALVKDSPHPEQGELLLEDLLSEGVARQLADGPNALVPLREGVAASDRVKTPDEVRAMAADFPAAAEHWDATAKILGELFAAP